MYYHTNSMFKGAVMHFLSGFMPCVGIGASLVFMGWVNNKYEAYKAKKNASKSCVSHG